jgi:hypothetical protein
MSNAIQFLEILGSSPALIQGAAEAYDDVVSSLQIDTAQRLALLDRDVIKLTGLLNTSGSMFCLVATPNDDEQEADMPDDQDGDGVPDKDEPFPDNK